MRAHAACCAGWSFQKTGARKRQQDGTLSYGIPYSEHSSWEDLRACVRALRPKKLVRSSLFIAAKCFVRVPETTCCSMFATCAVNVAPSLARRTSLACALFDGREHPCCSQPKHGRHSVQIPTVNVKDQASMDAMVNKFADLMDLSESKKHLDFFFRASAASPAAPSTPSPLPSVKSLPACATDACSRPEAVASLADRHAGSSMQNCNPRTTCARTGADDTRCTPADTNDGETQSPQQCTEPSVERANKRQRAGSTAKNTWGVHVGGGAGMLQGPAAASITGVVHEHRSWARVIAPVEDRPPSPTPSQLSSWLGLTAESEDDVCLEYDM